MDFRALAMIANMLGAVAAFLFFGYPELVDWKAARVKNIEAQERLVKEELSTKNFESIKVQVAARAQDIERLEAVAPKVADPITDTPELLSVVAGLARESGVIVKSVSAPAPKSSKAPGTAGGQAKKSQGAQPSVSAEALAPRQVTMSILATPRGLRLFLANAARSVRILELESLGFTVDPEHEAADISLILKAFIFAP